MIHVQTFVLPLLLMLFTACACGGPDRLDVEADRARWTAIQATAADGVLDAGEAHLLTELLDVWDEKLKTQEQAISRPRDAREILTELLRVYGPAVVQVAFGEDLLARAPELYRFADRNGNNALETDELLALDPLDPVFAVVVTSTMARLIRGQK